MILHEKAPEAMCEHQILNLPVCLGKLVGTEDPHYDDSVCYQRLCCKMEFAVIKKLEMDPSEA